MARRDGAEPARQEPEQADETRQRTAPVTMAEALLGLTLVTEVIGAIVRFVWWFLT